MKQLLTWPNILTGFRLLLVPVLIVCFSLEQSVSIALLTWLLFSIAAITDWFDGYLARKYDSETVLGKLMDPLADKLLVTTALVMLIPLGRLPAWVSLLIISRELIITGLRGLAASTGKVVPADNLGKIKANFQYFGLGLMIFPLGVVPIPYQYELALILVYISLVLSLWSAFDYFYKLKDVFIETSST
ncbi:MAG: CDP-diacylglycerol--glycerol-3-phosphate 3-phosphatidyltransferase [Thermodesulfobacteriota bacterium]